MSKFSDFLDYFKLLKNPISCLLFKFGFKKNVVVKAKNTNKTVKVDKIKDINTIMSTLQGIEKLDDFIDFFNDYLCNRETLKWNGLNIPNFHNSNLELGSFFELYQTGYWNTFDVDYNNRTIIDIGSNGGDSSLYFACEGAEVYGFEPVKPLYEFSLKF